MNKKLEQLMTAIETSAYDRAVNSVAEEAAINGGRYQDAISRGHAISLNQRHIAEHKAAIRELFQAKVYADASVGELITALRDEAYLHGYAIAMQDVGRVANVKTRGQRADAAEDALRKALGVQR